MKKILTKISNSREHRSSAHNHKLAKKSNQDRSAYLLDEDNAMFKNLDENGNKLKPTKESDGFGSYGDNNEISDQNDSKKDTNIFLIEDYAELLVQKLRPLNSNIDRARYNATGNKYSRIGFEY